jgi:hypothetical protein
VVATPGIDRKIQVVYQILGRDEVYVELGGDYYDRRNKPKVIARILARLSRLGFYAELRPISRKKLLPTSSPLPSFHANPAGPASATSVESSAKICKHRTSQTINPVIQQTSSAVIFSKDQAWRLTSDLDEPFLLSGERTKFL